MEIGQRLAVIERPHLGHEPREKIVNAVGLGGEGREVVARLQTLLVGGAFQQHPLCPAHSVLGRHI